MTVTDSSETGLILQRNKFLRGVSYNQAQARKRDITPEAFQHQI
jgi:hypothetical protein